MQETAQATGKHEGAECLDPATCASGQAGADGKTW